MPELNKLDFVSGIKAEKINDNFNVVDTWIKNERRRIGGYGLVEGFQLSTDINNFTTTIGKGVFINNLGEEKEIPEKTFYCDVPEYTEVIEELECPKDGVLKLLDNPYSPSEKKYMKYIPPELGKYPNTDELYVYNKEDNMRVQILQISDKDIYINPMFWIGKTICVKYKKAGNRIDSIVLMNNGTYRYEKSVNSISPSHVQIKDYENDFLIGAIYWQITDEGIKTSFYTNHRTYRTVYVDEQNRLWLNGELYVKQKGILFEEPEVPEPNDMWYDKDTNNLYIYKMYEGIYQWIAVNDHSTMTIRDFFMFIPGEKNYPLDSQTFIFPEDRLDLHFVPDTNALEIVIDNAPLMADQFEEIKKENEGKVFLSQGRGFKLKDPLDRDTYVQVIVNHQVKSNLNKETFQRAAIFVDENYMIYSTNNVNKIFETNEYYTAGEDQLEVFLNGIRLTPREDFIEMKNQTDECTQEELDARKTVTRYFKLTSNPQLNAGDKVTYKISKYVWNYDQLSLLMGTTLSDITELTNKVNTNIAKIEALNSKLVDVTNELNQKIADTKNQIPDKAQFIKKDDVITLDNLDNSIKEKLIDNAVLTYEMNTTMLQTIQSLSTEDFIQVFYMSTDETRVLIRNTDYTINNVSGGISIDLNPSLINRNATLYINAIKKGVD